MPRRCSEDSLDYDPPKKKSSSDIASNVDLKQGEVVTDISGKKWKLGRPVGIGGFGKIYQVSEDITKDVRSDTPYVAKIEKHSNGPLFVEINCYLRIGKSDMIKKWKQQKCLNFLGIPHYVASGSHIYKDEKYRFLIIPKYDNDLEAVFQSKMRFNLKTVLNISTQIVDVLEYIHSNGYVHSDIKASNIMLGKVNHKVTRERQTDVSLRKSTLRSPPKRRRECNRTLRPVGNIRYLDDIPYLDEVLNRHEEGWTLQNQVDTEQDSCDSGESVFLLDFGLASRYILSNGDHREFSTDQRRAHAGTVLFCSRDAHKGVPSRRSDLESLAYNMVYWLTGSLPWIEDIGEPELVERKKNICCSDLKSFLRTCFADDCPSFMYEFFSYLDKLEFEATPNYNFCRNLFKKAIKEYGYRVNSDLDFDNLEGWGTKQKQKVNSRKNRENKDMKPSNNLLMGSPRVPLHSNIIFKRPKLRKKVKNICAKYTMMNWSKILMDDPETIMKQKPRNRKTTEGSDPGSGNVLVLDLAGMNPTQAMIDVFNRCVDRGGVSPKQKGDELVCLDHIEGYTPEMMRIHTKMIERNEIEFEKTVEYNNNHIKSRNSHKNSAKKRGSQKRIKRPESPVRMSSRSSKSQTNVTSTKKEALHLRKVKSVPLRRVYTLRG